MNKKILWAIVAVVVLVGFWFAFGRKPDNKIESTSGQNEQQQTAQTPQQSMKELLASGRSQQCQYGSTDSSASSQGTVYIGSGKMRGDFTSQVNGKETKSHMIVMDSTSYLWMDGTTMGYKMTTTEQTSAAQQPSQSIDQDKKMDYQCQNWSADSSMFNLPSGVTFTDMMSAGTMPSGSSASSENSASMKAQQCAACDSAPESARAQCRAALACQ